MASQLGYLLHYRRNVNKLINQMDILGRLRADVQQLVNVARSRGQLIKQVVQSWLITVDATEREGLELESRVTTQLNNGCLQDCGGRYSVGKEAKRKIIVLNHLIRVGGEFGDAVSIPRSGPPGMEIMPMPDFRLLESTNLAMEEVVKALEDKKFNLVGVHGMGGVEKTTLMEATAKELKNRGLFDRIVMVTVSQNLNLKKIQGDIASNLGYPLNAQDESVRARCLSERIKQEKRILIILDDVREEVPLRMVGITFVDNCSIIITRFLYVCEDMKTQYNVELKVLSEAEARELFQIWAGNCMDSLELREVAMEVVKGCRGLPIALVTVGKALRGKHKRQWEDAVTQLKKPIPSIRGCAKEWEIRGLQLGLQSPLNLG